MDWLYVLMPISGVTIFWPGLIILGLGVGIIGGFFGMGGAWMVTPGLNILGFPMAFAIGILWQGWCPGVWVSSTSWMSMKAQRDPYQEALLLLPPTCYPK